MRTPEKDQEDHDSMDPSEDRGTVGSLPLTSSTSFTATPPLPIRNQGSGEALIKFKSGVVRGGGEKVEQGGGWIDSNRFGSQAGSIFRLLSKLEDLSVEKSIHLPRLVLLGNQSVGKSSLVEVISGITVPRCFGTCTRGPLDVITRPPGSEDEEEGEEVDVEEEEEEEVVVVGKNGGGGAKLFEPKWSAKVSLKIRKVGGGGNLSGTGGDGGFRVIPFGPRIQDQSKVSERLRRAAVALRNLNHNQGGGGGRGGMMVGNLKEFLWMDLEELSGYEGSGGSEVNFFTDRIEVEVVGSGMPPLRFTDLPGIFTNGDREEIETVEAMILDEIKDPECLIAQVASLSMDYANQSSFNLSGKVDPGGERTIGIFTMPDLLQLEGDLSWLPVLRGEKARLRHGWHVVKCPSPRDLSNVPTMGGGAEGRERNEQDFFQRSDTAWASVASEIDQDFLRKRLGSRNLCSFLGGLLLQRVKKRLPGCLDSIREARLLKEDQLSELPKGREEDLLSSLSPLEELFNLCRDLTTKFNHLCCESDELLQAEEKLRLSVSDCSPDYVPFSSEEIEDHEVEALFVPRPFHPSSSASGSSIVPPPSRPCPSENDLDSEILDQDSKRLTKDQIRRMKNLDQVRIALRLQRTYLPSAVGLLATTHQVDAQGRFAKVSKPYVKQTKSALGQVINRLIHQVFQEWPDLKGRVTEVVHRMLSKHLKVEEEKLLQSLRVQGPPGELSVIEMRVAEELDMNRRYRIALWGSKLNLSREEVKEFREKAYQALTNLGWPITSRSNKGKDKKSLRYLTVTSQVANSFERELEAISYSNVIFDLLASNFLDQARKVSSNVLSSLQEDLARNLSRELRGNASDEEEIRVKYFQRRSSGRFGSEFGTEEEDLDSKRQRIESELEQLEITSSELEKLEKRFLSLPLTPSSDGGDGRKGRIRDSRFPTTLTSTPSTPRRNVDGGSFNASQSSPTKRKRRGAADGDLDEDLAQLEFEQDFGSLHPSPRKKLF